MMEFAEASQFAGVFTTMVGYVVVAFGLVILHTLLYVVGLNKLVDFITISIFCNSFNYLKYNSRGQGTDNLRYMDAVVIIGV